MPKINLISAVGTPLNPDESLHVDSLDRLLSLQWNAGIDGVLVAGTMGLMQLLREQTYVQLIEHSIELCRGKGELLVGIGDAGFARTADRIGYINGLAVDGVGRAPALPCSLSTGRATGLFSCIGRHLRRRRCFYMTSLR